MPRTQAVYYRAPDGSEPVDDFVAGLDERKQPTVDLQIDRLNDQPTTAPPPPFPHSSQVRGQMRELLSLRLRALSGSLPALRQPDRPAPHAAQGHGLDP